MTSFWVCTIRNLVFSSLVKKHLNLASAIAIATLVSGAPPSGAVSLQPVDERSSSNHTDMPFVIAQNREGDSCQPFPDDQVSGIVFVNGAESYEISGKAVSLYPEAEATQTLAHRDGGFRDELDALIEPYLGTRVTLADLRSIQDAVSLLYLQEGYVTSWADCARLDKQGKLIIEVTEGFIPDLNIGWLNEESTVYVPAEDGPRDWQYAADYLAPVLRTEDGLPQRPVNIEKLEARLQDLAADPRFAALDLFSRLRVPMRSPLETAIDLQQQLEGNPSIQTRYGFKADTLAPGASVLEIQLQNIVARAEDVAEDPQASNLVSSAVRLEQRRSQQFLQYFGQGSERSFLDPTVIRFALHSLEQRRPEIKAAVVYIQADGNRVVIRAETSSAPPIEIQDIARFETKAPERDTYNSENDQFESEGNNVPLGSRVFNFLRGNPVGRDTLVVEAEQFWRLVQNPNSREYREFADKLYDLLIRPIKNEFDEQGIEVNTLIVAMDPELGLLPLSSLYNFETGQYLSEEYRLAIIPSFRGLDIRPSSLSQADVLAMGASEFREASGYAPLTAVPIELRLIESIWEEDQVKVLNNEDFTLSNLRRERRNYPYSIVHLASHANFRTGRPGDSSIQFWDTSLPLSPLQLSTLNFNDAPLELLVLSACQTALGDEDAFLGFAGSFLDADVKSVLASLWYTNDLASLLYMMEFYRNLSTGLTKAEAVQNTQLAFLDEQRTMQNLKELALVVQSILNNDRSREKLTEAELERLKRLSFEINEDKISELAEELTHPFYWSAYTLVGSPW
jgi:CHAT domain-containing protein